MRFYNKSLIVLFGTPLPPCSGGSLSPEPHCVLDSRLPQVAGTQLRRRIAAWKTTRFIWMPLAVPSHGPERSSTIYTVYKSWNTCLNWLP